jgi:predicted dehydrogenase
MMAARPKRWGDCGHGGDAARNREGETVGLNATRTNGGPPLVKPPTGVAIIGCGYWGINYVRVFADFPDAFVLSVCDQREARLAEIERRFADLAVTQSVDEALDLPGVDVAVIATEAQSHHDLAMRALERGKHVLIEKPLTLRAHEASELIELAEERSLVLLVGHTFIYNPGVSAVKERIVEGDLGRVYYAYSRRTSLGPIRHDVNALWDLAAHDIAIFNFLLDSQPEWVSAVGAKVLRNSREDVGFIALGYPGELVAHVHVSWADPNKVREVVVVGSDRRIVFNDLDPLERVRIFDKGVKAVHEPTSWGEYHFQLRDGSITSPAVPFLEPLKSQCGHFLHCVRRGERPRTDGRHGRAVVQAMEAIEASVAQRGAPVPVNGWANGSGNGAGNGVVSQLAASVAAAAGA